MLPHIRGDLQGQTGPHVRTVLTAFDADIGQFIGGSQYTLACGLVEPGSGRLILIDRDSLLAIEINPEGKLLFKTRLKGKGTAEIESCVFAGWLRETLWISDVQLSRVSLFDREFKTGSSQFVSLRSRNRNGDAYVRALVGTNEVLVEMSEPRDSAIRGASRVPLVRRSLDPRKVLADTVAVSEVRHRRLVLAGLGRTSFLGFQPWSDDPLIRVGPHSDLVARVERRAAKSSTMGQVDVTVVDLAGHLVANWSYHYKPLALDQASVETTLTPEIAALSWHPLLRDSSEAMKWLRQHVFVPKYWPGVVEAMVAGDSTIWLRRAERHMAGSDSVLWTGHALNGTEFAALVLPASFFPLGADSHSIVGVRITSEWLVQGIARYRF
jgi:hypothetical protein